jgi:heme-degrading monooxygenase HmoA
MKATITSIELKDPFKFFALSAQALAILRQLKTTEAKEFKKRGLWKKHYTMTLWENEKDLKDFAHSGAHLEAMKRSKQIAKEIRTITIDTQTLPTWKEAKKLLEQAHVVKF